MQIKEIKTEIINCIDTVIEPYSLLLVEEGLLTNYVNYLKKKFELSLLMLNERELLFEQEVCLNMITAYLNEQIGNLLTNSFVDKILMTNNFTNFNLGNSTQEIENTQNYQGFDLTNQDGQFSKQTQNSITTNANDRLQYLVFLQNATSNWINKIINWINSNICVIIY